MAEEMETSSPLQAEVQPEAAVVHQPQDQMVLEEVEVVKESVVQDSVDSVMVQQDPQAPIEPEPQAQPEPEPAQEPEPEPTAMQIDNTGRAPEEVVQDATVTASAAVAAAAAEMPALNPSEISQVASLTAPTDDAQPLPVPECNSEAQGPVDEESVTVTIQQVEEQLQEQEVGEGAAEAPVAEATDVNKEATDETKEVVTATIDFPIKGKNDQKWHSFFVMLQQHLHAHGSLEIEPKSNLPLEEWVSKQQKQYKNWKENQKSNLTPERRLLLNALGFDWEKKSSKPAGLRSSLDGFYSTQDIQKWQDRLGQLEKYKAIHGHPNVPETFKEDPALGKWVAQQRAMYRKESLTHDRFLTLEALGFDFTPGDKKVAFEARLEQLKDYKERYGDARVPRKWVENPGLGEWLHSQKKMYRRWENNQKGGMTEERRRILLEIGVDFSVMEPGPRPNLHSVQLQAQAKAESSMPDVTVTKTDEAGGPVLNRVSKWDEKFSQLQAYKTVHGHTNVPRRSKRNPANDALGEWAHFQRRQFRNLMSGKTSTMTIARKKALEYIHFQWSRSGSILTRSLPIPNFTQKGIPSLPPIDLTSPEATEEKVARLSWDEGYAQLLDFHVRHGHTNVPENWPENPSLSLWISRQKELGTAWGKGQEELAAEEKDGECTIKVQTADIDGMTEERFTKLVEMNFDFGTSESRAEVTPGTTEDQVGETVLDSPEDINVETMDMATPQPSEALTTEMAEEPATEALKEDVTMEEAASEPTKDITVETTGESAIEEAPRDNIEETIGGTESESVKDATTEIEQATPTEEVKDEAMEEEELRMEEVAKEDGGVTAVHNMGTMREMSNVEEIDSSGVVEDLEDVIEVTIGVENTTENMELNESEVNMILDSSAVNGAVTEEDNSNIVANHESAGQAEVEKADSENVPMGTDENVETEVSIKEDGPVEGLVTETAPETDSNVDTEASTKEDEPVENLVTETAPETDGNAETEASTKDEPVENLVTENTAEKEEKSEPTSEINGFEHPTETVNNDDTVAPESETMDDLETEEFSDLTNNVEVKSVAEGQNDHDVQMSTEKNPESEAASLEQTVPMDIEETQTDTISQEQPTEDVKAEIEGTPQQQTTVADSVLNTTMNVVKKNTVPLLIMWEERYLELIQYKLRKGNCNVPPKWKPNPGLADWVRRQRQQHQLFKSGEPSVLNQFRVGKLNLLGFDYDLEDVSPTKDVGQHVEAGPEQVSKPPRTKKVPVKKRVMKSTPRKSRYKEGKWLESLSKVVAYKEAHGSCNVPRKWKPDPQLGEWCHFQRRQFRLKQLGKRNHMTDDRIEKLESVGFEWSRGSQNPPSYMRVYEENKASGAKATTAESDGVYLNSEEIANVVGENMADALDQANKTESQMPKEINELASDVPVADVTDVTVPPEEVPPPEQDTTQNDNHIPTEGSDSVQMHHVSESIEI